MSDIQSEENTDLTFEHSRWIHVSFGARDMFSQ